MKRTSPFAGLLALTLSLLSACDSISIESNRALSRRDTSLRASDTGSFAAKGLLSVAVEFPPGYDWRRDSCYGAVRGRLAVRSGRKELFALDAGPGTGISLDADRHRLIGSDLFSEAGENGVTIYKRNGETLFEAPGREILRGMYVSGGDIYTLSENASGEGFALRKNYRELLSRPGGQIHGSLSDPLRLPSGALYEEDGEPCFIYSSASGTSRRWYLVKGTDERELRVPLGVGTVYDIAVRDETVYIVCRSTAGRAPVLFVGEELHDLWWTLAVKRAESDFRLFCEDGIVKVCGSYYARGRGETRRTAHWTADGLEATYPLECSVFRGGSYVSREDGLVREIALGGLSDRVVGSWRLASPRCVSWDGEAVALTPADEGNPSIWRGGKIEGYEFNGFFSELMLVQ